MEYQHAVLLEIVCRTHKREELRGARDRRRLRRLRVGEQRPVHLLQGAQQEAVQLQVRGGPGGSGAGETGGRAERVRLGRLLEAEFKCCRGGQQSGNDKYFGARVE